MTNSRTKLALALVLGMGSPLLAADTAGTVQVYKSPSCGCCTDWVKHLEDNGFEVTVTEMNNLTQVKTRAGLSPALASCHTAFVDGYVIEGHVPASDIRRLITQSPDALGLTVPGMPAGSPGMEMGNVRDHYQVLMFNRRGQTRVFAEYN